jgi:hypothetical protein
VIPPFGKGRLGGIFEERLNNYETVYKHHPAAAGAGLALFGGEAAGSRSNLGRG